ncbi:xyloglucan endotransglucosylase/hydrolase protein 2 [Phtheirospermum japonicum]|uniref:Xyloglucan endotransglucosylase/hydrolase n=1 Tax=Phtheirospermum japonicum TaxID=374723 RepID=A0A830CU90_9LAMI|nr:xyloglucan endotransglucosylase/hydrolase protein 2 [Phtheirospermum japonicum]
MGTYQLCFLAIFWVFAISGADVVRFDASYQVLWGADHVKFLNQEREVQLSLDLNSGAAFGSKLSYGSGFFHMRIKVPNKNTSGVITTFYLISDAGDTRDEVDFEFLGNSEGEPITLQTNVYTNGQGYREQRVLLWFDPTTDFHTYKILWNQHHIVFYVDNTPIRVFKNNTNIGVMYPKQAMQIQASLWNASWASVTKIDWSCAPFLANYQDFNIVACPLQSGNYEVCYVSKYWWNQEKYWKLTRFQQKLYDNVRKEYMNYDYCDDRNRYPTPPPECASNRNAL